MKPIVKHIVRYGQLAVVLALLLGAGVLLAQKSLTHKDGLMAKRDALKKENKQVAAEVRTMEREVMQLRSDPKTIEKVAKRKLGMSRPDETVYVFDEGRKVSPGAPASNATLNN